MDHGMQAGGFCTSRLSQRTSNRTRTCENCLGTSPHSATKSSTRLRSRVHPPPHHGLLARHVEEPRVLDVEWRVVDAGEEVADLGVADRPAGHLGRGHDDHELDVLVDRPALPRLHEVLAAHDRRKDRRADVLDHAPDVRLVRRRVRLVAEQLEPRRPATLRRVRRRDREAAPVRTVREEPPRRRPVPKPGFTSVESGPSAPWPARSAAARRVDRDTLRAPAGAPARPSRRPSATAPVGAAADAPCPTPPTPTRPARPTRPERAWSAASAGASARGTRRERRRRPPSRETTWTTLQGLGTT